MNAHNSKISLFVKSRHSHGVKKFWVLMFQCAQYNLFGKLFRHCANFNHFYSSSPFLSGSIFVSAIKEGVFLGALQIPSQSSRQILSSDFESTDFFYAKSTLANRGSCDSVTSWNWSQNPENPEPLSLPCATKENIVLLKKKQNRSIV